MTWEIPEQALPQCAHPNCGKRIPFEEHSRMAREVTGWEVPRKGGGLHHLLERRETERVLCANHTRMLRDGYGPDRAAAPTQGSFL